MMNNNSVRTILIICLVTLAQLCQTPASAKATNTAQNSSLLVHLPREITVKESNLKLGQITIIVGSDSLAAKAADILMGRISLPGQEVVLNRSVILSRLASNGIPADKVTLTGAEEVKVQQQQKIIEGSAFIEYAKSFLQKNLPAESVCGYEPIWTPEDFILPGPNKKLRLQGQLVEGVGPGQARARITVFADDKEIAQRQVAFRLKYKCRRAVTMVDIPAGTIISPENVKVEQIVSNQPEPAYWRLPYGLTARHYLPANRTIGPNMAAETKTEILIERNETVVIQIRLPGLQITASGKSLQKGRAGELVKVRNIDSQRIIICKINADGTVQPLF